MGRPHEPDVEEAIAAGTELFWRGYDRASPSNFTGAMRDDAKPVTSPHGASMSDDDIAEFFAALGPVTIRRMFSGKGVYVGGVIVAIEYGGELRLKADLISAPEFAAAGSTQWAYDGHRGAVMMPYWSIPDEALDDPDLMEVWVRRAFAAGLRAPAGKKARTARE